MIREYNYKGKKHYLIQLSITDANGKRHQPKYRHDMEGKRITSRRRAEDLEYKYRRDFEDGLLNRNKNQPFGEYHKEFLRQIRLTHKRSTVMQYDGDLAKWLPSEFLLKNISDFTKSDLHDFLFIELPNMGATSNTQKKTLKTLRRIFQSAHEEGLITRNPTIGITVSVPVSEKRVLNTTESNQLLSMAHSQYHLFYYHWALALFTGMRSGELYALRWTDIDLVTGNISVSHSWSKKDGYGTTKSNKVRIVPISDDLRRLLLELKNHGPYTEDLSIDKSTKQIFDDLVLPRSKEWRYGEQASVLRRFCKSIGITEVAFHDLRATFITNLLSQGVSTPKVMSIVGHARMSTTDEYLRLAGVDVKGSTDALGYALPRESCDKIVELRGGGFA